MRRSLYITLLVVSLACAREEKDLSQDSPQPNATNTNANPTAGTADNTQTMQPVVPVSKDLPSQRAGGAAVAAPEVQLQEYDIRMEDVLPAGPITLQLANAGHEDHGFDVEGNGVHIESPVLKRGDRTSLELNLKPGTYEVYCPVDGHKGKGMKRTVTVK